MLLPKNAVNWNTAKARCTPTRAMYHSILRSPLIFIIPVAFFTLFIFVGLRGSAQEMQRFYCWGPPKSPFEMSTNERALWDSHLQTPVLFNHHVPVQLNSSTIERVNLNAVASTPKAMVNEERILILTPLRDAAHYMDQHFDLLTSLTYPHHLIDLAFLVGDSKDDTLAVLAKELDRVQNLSGSTAFRSAMIVEKDFGAASGMDVEDRHKVSVQAERRKLMGKARNYLMSAALKPEHSWVYWRDVDIKESPSEIIEHLTAHDRDIIVPNIWFHRYKVIDGRKQDIEGRFDYNSWQESPSALSLAASLPKDTILAEGYKEYPTRRTHMAQMGDWRDDKDIEIPLDGIGGVNIMVKADVHRAGINFPCYAFENQAETEGFAKMARRAGFGVWGLPNYVVWHVDTQEKPGNV